MFTFAPNADGFSGFLLSYIMNSIKFSCHLVGPATYFYFSGVCICTTYDNIKPVGTTKKVFIQYLYNIHIQVRCRESAVCLTSADVLHCDVIHAAVIRRQQGEELFAPLRKLLQLVGCNINKHINIVVNCT